MARALLNKHKTLMAFSSRTFASSPLPSLFRADAPALRRLCPISSVFVSPSVSRSALRPFSTRATSSSLNDPNPNWSNRPPKETILLDGCDFEHWLVVVEKPDENLTRDEIIDHYIKVLAQVVGSEQEARMKIYSISTRHYFAFGALVSEELSYKLKELPGVRWVLPDSYLDVKNKDYGGEPFINGQAVPYDPKYHEEWVRNNARANERNRRNDRPRNNDRSRNFDRRRENMQRRDFQNTSPPPYQPTQHAAPNMGGGGMQQMPPQNMGGGGMQQMPPQNMGGGGMQQMPPQNMGGGGMQQMPPQNMGGGGMQQMPPQNMGGGGMQQIPPQNVGGGRVPHMPPHNNIGGGGMPPSIQPQSNMGGMPTNNHGGMQQSPPNAGVMPPNQGWSNMPPQQNYNSFHNQMQPPNPQQQSYGRNMPGGNPQSNQD